MGYDYVHVAVDVHSRQAYVEVINTGDGGGEPTRLHRVPRRAHAWFADHDVTFERIVT